MDITNTGKEKTNLLILPCSKQKKKLDNVPAIELYDGPFYRIIKKHNLSNIVILIVSAKYGLINSDEVISFYDQKMTRIRAKEIASEINSKMEGKIDIDNYDKIFINLGKDYMRALEGSNIICNNNVVFAKGKIGERLHQLKNWLVSIDPKEHILNDN